MSGPALMRVRGGSAKGMVVVRGLQGWCESCRGGGVWAAMPNVRLLSLSWG